jgi:hypothetical protein
MSIFTENGITFNNVTDPIITTGGNMFARGQYSKTGSQINLPQKVLNAIDIDWNNANVPGLPTPINNTSQILKILGELYSGIAGGSNTYKHVILTREEYDEITEYDDNTLYFVIGEDESDSPEQQSYLKIINLNTGEEINKISGIVTLDPGYKYELSGTLNDGYIIVDCSEKSENDMKNIGNTILCLNNVTINSPENYGIIYTVPTHIDAETGEIVKDNKGFKDLVITVYRNTINTINCTKEIPGDTIERPNNQEAAIYSMNNLTIQGAGYLIISNTFGHGLRGSELRYCGPYSYFDVYHDAIHGKKIDIEDGIVYVANGNDVVGTGESGRIMVYGGVFYSNGTLLGQVFDSSLNGLMFTDNITILGNTSVNNMLEFNQTNFITVVKEINNLNELNNGVYVAVKNNKGDIIPGAQIELSANNTYNIVDNDSIYVTGIIEYPIILRREDSTVYLNNAFISNSHTEGAIYYNTGQEAVKGKLKIMCESDTINYVNNNFIDTSNMIINSIQANTDNIPLTIGNYGYDAIKSENNIEIEIKNSAHLCVKSNYGDGIDGGNVLINDSKGCILVENCGLRGIKGNTIMLGVNANIVGSNTIIYYDDPSVLSENDADKVKYFDGAIIVKNNCKISGVNEHNKQLAGESAAKNYGFGDVYARNGKASLGKGIIATRTKVINGVIIIGNIGAVKMIDLDNCNTFYYYYNITDDTLIGIENLINMPDPLNSNTIVYNKNKTALNVI